MTTTNEQHIRMDLAMTQAEADAAAVIQETCFRREELENLNESVLSDFKDRIRIFLSYYELHAVLPKPSPDVGDTLARAMLSGDYGPVYAMLPKCFETAENMFTRFEFACERVD